MKRARAVKLLQNKCKYRHRKAQSVIILVLITLAPYMSAMRTQIDSCCDCDTCKMLRLQFIYSTLIRIISFCFVSFRLVKHLSCTYPSVQQWRQQRKWTHSQMMENKEKNHQSKWYCANKEAILTLCNEIRLRKEGRSKKLKEHPMKLSFLRFIRWILNK